MIVKTRLATNDLWQTRALHPKLGELVVAQAKSPTVSQALAMQFLDANFPDELIEWEDGYHGFDIDSPKGRTHWANWDEC